MASQRYRREDYDFDLEEERYRHERRRSRSRSASRGRRPYRHSRSRTPERHRRSNYRRERDDSRSRSRSRSRGFRERRGRYRNDSTRSRSPSPRRRTTDKRQSDDEDKRQQHKTEERRSQYNAADTLKDESNTSSSVASYHTESVATATAGDLSDFPLPPSQQSAAIGAYYNLECEEPVIDKERIHREIEAKLRATLAKEGKVYPPPKPEASHPVFANDGSFLEIFKKMQEVQKPSTSAGAAAAAITAAAVPSIAAAATNSTTAAYVAATASGKSAPPPPIVGRRRGGKILKTGVVAKQKTQADSAADPKDFWSLYLAEVNKYKNNACESDGGTRPLVK